MYLVNLIDRIQNVRTYSAEGLANVALLQQESVVVPNNTPNQVGRHFA